MPKGCSLCRKLPLAKNVLPLVDRGHGRKYLEAEAALSGGRWRVPVLLLILEAEAAVSGKRMLLIPFLMGNTSHAAF